MRFDFLTALISPGLYAPLALMVGGFLLAVACLAFLLFRRRKGAKPAKSARSAVGASEAEDTAEAAQEAPPVAAAPALTGRRRSLVGGAERDEGTPSGELEQDGKLEQESADEIAEEAEPEIEEAEFIEAGEANEAEFDEVGEADGAELEDETPQEEPADEPVEEPSDFDFEEDAEPEWIEDIGDEPEVGLEEAAAAGGAAVAAAGGAQATPYQEPSPYRPVSAEVEAARKRPIVFRQFLPQTPGKDGLSFYGGQPIGPDEFQWPRERGAEGGAPLQFLMQWDCTQLTEQDPTGLLPQDGVLYCFVNCDRDDEEDFLSSHTFVHYRGSVKAWKPIDIPEDAGPALGKTAALKMSGCTDQIANADDYVPRVMPRFPFTPIAFRFPDGDNQEHSYWSEDAADEALLGIQKSGVAVPPSADDIDELDRPFPSFPHDFGAVRVIATRMIEALQQPDHDLAEALYTQLSPDERQAQFDGWCEEAKELYLLGTQRPEGHRLEPNIADDIWNWFDARRSILGTDLSALVVEAVDLSLSVSSEALGNIPAKWIDKAMDAHALAREYEGDEGLRIHAPVPARMFGPPSFADGQSQALLDEQILLLELPSGSGPQHDFEGKVLQYWISPDDLAAGKFDEVTPVVIGG